VSYQPPQHPPQQPTSGQSPGPAKRKKWPWIVAAAVVGGVGLCTIGSLNNNTSAPAPAGGAALSMPPDPGPVICKVTEDAGSYYLLLNSAIYRNFSLCDGAVPYPHTIDDLLKQKGMDSRCVLPNSYTSANHVLVGVYSARKKPDLEAARAFCRAEKGTQ
jgi:hypothetical protein